MVANLLCLRCMVKKLSANVDVCSIEFSGAMLDITIKKAAFACIMSVRCKRGHHLFTLEPSRAPIPEEHDPNSNKGHANSDDTNDNNNVTSHDPHVNVDASNNGNVNSDNTSSEEIHDNTTRSDNEETSCIELECNAVQMNNKKRKGRPKSTDGIQHFSINYQAYMLMQLFWNGVTGLDMLLGMLGLGVHSGSRRSWALLMSCCGEAQQKVADAVQKQNLHNEIAVMQSKGIQQIMDQGKPKWPLTVSYDMAWQK